MILCVTRLHRRGNLNQLYRKLPLRYSLCRLPRAITLGSQICVAKCLVARLIAWAPILAHPTLRGQPDAPMHVPQSTPPA